MQRNCRDRRIGRRTKSMHRMRRKLYRRRDGTCITYCRMHINCFLCDSRLSMLFAYNVGMC
ncbi:hypothetical protein B4U79_10511 [Dinothrombium tinctorium]|uniref:Uncharacterized protein n=1 Tax=Dinothrombium tinctorium TaxID=1965070 RepID=A0A3S3P0N5_9ACAR|nr:hypothetical protein B4U79_10511 [Dinothrombium tinctorium]